MRRILIFGGTTEGRLLAQALSRRGVPAAVSVATVLGAEELSGLPGITPLVGRRTAEEMAALLSGYDKCVDATHPYARDVSANIRSACRSAGVPLRRLLRRSSELPPGSILADSPEEAAQLLQSREGNVLLAIGAKGVSAFSGLDPERLYPRVVYPPAAGRGSPPKTSSPCTAPSPKNSTRPFWSSTASAGWSPRTAAPPEGSGRRSLRPGILGSPWWSLGGRRTMGRIWMLFWSGC